MAKDKKTDNGTTTLGQQAKDPKATVSNISESSKKEGQSAKTGVEVNTPSENTDSLFNIGRFFVKKIEFDGSAAAALVNQNQIINNPETKIELALTNTPLPNHLYEVDLTITATATYNEKPLFVGSVEQAGIFTARNFSVQQLDFILKGYCPSLLFPYARENIANVMLRGGFKPLDLPAIDFVTLYQKSLQSQQLQNK